MIPSQDSLTRLGQKVDGHYKIQSCTQKTDKFHGIEQSIVFKDSINMHAASYVKSNINSAKNIFLKLS